MLWNIEYDRIERAEEVAAVYRTVVVGVLSAAITSFILAAVLLQLGLTTSAKARFFVLYISACAGAHIVLWAFYRRRPPGADDWRGWGHAFAFVSFCEGLGWGWSPIALSNGRFDAELLCLVVTVGISAGSVSAFGPYRPAFFALFLTSSLPYALHLALAQRPIQRGEGVLMIIYLIGIGAFGLLTNRSFRRLVRLRLEAETLATRLEAQIEIAEAANRAKSSFLAAASHDLRQPVHALGLFVGALQGMKMSSEARRVVARIETSTLALDSLFSTLLDISRLDAKVVDVDRRAFAIAPLLDRIVADHTSEALAKGVRLVMHRSSAILFSDPVLVERILRNLVSNAVRYTKEGRVVVGCRRIGGSVRVEVWDTGPGIPADQRERIFEEYYQLGNSERDRAKGLGLGLAIVRRVASLLDCRLTLQSVPGRGSCFSVEIPVSTSHLLPAAFDDAAPTPMQRSQTIVFVDDEADIRVAMTMLLSRWGKNVIAAGSGAEAIERLAACPVCPELLICDFRLRDGENGIDVVRRLRSEYNTDIPAILITGDTAPERLVEARASGLLMLHKPISNARLRAAITNATAISNQAG